MVVPLAVLDDLCTLASIALDRLEILEPGDALQPAMRGALAEMRRSTVMEPVA